MSTAYTEGQIKLKNYFRDFGRKMVAPKAIALSQSGEFDQDSWDALCQTEFFRFLAGKEYGAKGGFTDFVAAFEGLACGAGDAGFLLATASHAAAIHVLRTSAAQRMREKYIPMLLSGDKVATALAEPHSGTDVGSYRTLLRETGPEAYSLSGEKTNISHAPHSELAIILARTMQGEEKGLNLVFMETDKEGYSSGDAEPKMGCRTLPTSWIGLDNVAIGRYNIIGKYGEGTDGLKHLGEMTRTLFGFAAAMLLKPALEEAMEFVGSRHSGGKPLAKHQHVQEHLVQIYASIEACRALAMSAFESIENGDGKAAKKAALVKWKGTEAITEGSRRLMAIFGSYGYREGTISHLAADAPGFLAAGGTVEAMKMTVFGGIKRGH